MIIHSIIAENLLKYRKLELVDLPENGTIAISGLNESGKSTIGETVCFALFGRTFSLDESELNKVVRWGETRCSVSMVFSVGDGKRYEITRYLDSDGNHSAGLRIVGEDDDPIARGLDAVEDALYKLTGFAYAEFIESFYLAQREITTPNPHSHTVKAMAGVLTMERCADEFKREVSRTEREIPDEEQNLGKLETDLKILAIDEARLAQLESERDDCTQRHQAKLDLLKSLKIRASYYQESLKTLKKARRGLMQSNILRIALFLATLYPLVAVLTMLMAPNSALSTALRDLLISQFPGWNPADLWPLVNSAIGLFLLLLFTWGLYSLLKKRVTALQQAPQQLADALGELDSVTDKTNQAPPEQLAGRHELRDKVLNLTATPEEIVLHIEQEEPWLNGVIGLSEEALADAERAVEDEQARLNQAAAMQEAVKAVQTKLQQMHQQIRQFGEAQALLNGAIVQLSQRFNHHLRGMACKTLPLFTEGRYEHLQIDEDLSVRAFSSEKHDFMELDEISSGTQRQIMLAVRIALSQELVDRAEIRRQFLFLDEPFAFFDESRTRNSLAVLPTLSKQLRQIWVIAQHFPEDVEFAKHIYCAREVEELSLGERAEAEPGEKTVIGS